MLKEYKENRQNMRKIKNLISGDLYLFTLNCFLPKENINYSWPNFFGFIRTERRRSGAKVLTLLIRLEWKKSTGINNVMKFMQYPVNRTALKRDNCIHHLELSKQHKAVLWCGWHSPLENINSSFIKWLRFDMKDLDSTKDSVFIKLYEPTSKARGFESQTSFGSFLCFLAYQVLVHLRKKIL